MGDNEIKVLREDLDPGNTGIINYDELLSAMYLTRMYLKQLNLTKYLNKIDTDNKGGGTIRQMQDL